MSKGKKIMWSLLSIFVFFPILITVIVSVAGVGGETTVSSTKVTPAKQTCESTTKEMLDSIESGMISSKYKIAGLGQVSLTAEQNAELTAISPGWDKNYVIAANISGGNLATPEIGLWGKSGNTGGLFALNDSALKYSDWGTAANDGSPAYQIRLKLLRFGTAQGALQCGK
ncbi:unannotated protein [freshwater metagenome]|uniref:Unannotated protein n=1 Tax=freshwater metagenome TaxID=449393 RepID=A0A6J7MBH0_9ZZZZ|nr:hypothetical protein [Actinomycetota bacterium]